MTPWARGNAEMGEKNGHHAREISGSIRPTVLPEPEASQHLKIQTTHQHLVVLVPSVCWDEDTRADAIGEEVSTSKLLFLVLSSCRCLSCLCHWSAAECHGSLKVVLGWLPWSKDIGNTKSVCRDNGFLQTSLLQVGKLDQLLLGTGSPYSGLQKPLLEMPPNRKQSAQMPNVLLTIRAQIIPSSKGLSQGKFCTIHPSEEPIVP